MTKQEQFTVFSGPQAVARGTLAQAAQAVKDLTATNDPRRILVFNDQSGAQVDIDLRDYPPPALDQSAEPPAKVTEPNPEPAPGPRRRGRPKLGVVGREITLLPRHWEWLNVQPGGPSVALRKLVEQARHSSAAADKTRQAREAVYRFISAIAGDEPGYEEACRALFADNREAFAEQTQTWPADVRNYARSLAEAAFTPPKTV